MRKQCTLLMVATALLAMHHASAQNWRLDGNGDASSTSKLGTTNAVPVRLLTNNLERLRIDPTGRVGIGITSPINILTVKTGGGVPSTSWTNVSTQLFYGFSEDANGEFNIGTATDVATRRSLIQGKRARGTLASPKVVQNNDYLASIIASGYDGSAFQNPAEVDFYVDGTPTAGHVPGRISFVTGTNITDRQERLKVGSTGDIAFNTSQVFIEQATGNVGIGLTNINAKLDIKNDLQSYPGINVNNTFVGNEDLTGIQSVSVNNPGYGYGVRGYGGYEGVQGIGAGTSFSGSVFGVSGQATGSDGNRYGVYGYAAGGSFNAAGYFAGDLYAVTYHTISDRKFKTDIAPLTNSLKQLMSLKPSAYMFKKDENNMGLPAGKQIGLIADELKEVYPELVTPAVKPAQYGKDRSQVISPEVKYESVNYIGLIPVLIASMQEQQKQIEELKDLVKQLSSTKDITTGLSNVTLEQNNPNPLSDYTNIRYTIPVNSKNAQLIVTDISGKKLKQVDLGSAPSGTVNFDATALSSGSYTYSIIVDGKLIETKKMIVAKTIK